MSSEEVVKKDEPRWFPLESNPELLNVYMKQMGWDTSKYQFMDVFSTESWALDMIPQPVGAVMLLYPIKRENDSQIRHVSDASTNLNKDVWHMKQTIGNACGTVGILHALANVSPQMKEMALINQSSALGKFYRDATTVQTPMEKANVLEENEEIAALHKATAIDPSNASSSAAEDEVDTHYVTFVHVNGGLYALDGRKSNAIRHCDTTESNLLQDACRVIQEEFMAKDPNELRFTILALAPTAS
eukprot:scaffold12028_cov50-Attheya_sp.AAC.1